MVPLYWFLLLLRQEYKKFFHRLALRCCCFGWGVGFMARVVLEMGCANSHVDLVSGVVASDHAGLGHRLIKLRLFDRCALLNP